MTIYSKIQAELNAARKHGDTRTLAVVQYIMGEIGRQRTIDTSDKAVIAEVKKVNKRINEAHNMAPTEKTQWEKSIMLMLMNEWLPKQMSIQELNVVIDKAIEAGATNIGQVMGKLKSTGVDFDGGKASQLIKQKLA